MKEKYERNRKITTEPSVRPKLTDLLEIPANALSGVPQIELAGNQEALVDGCQGILEYDENIIKLTTGKMSIKFTGRNLQIKVLTHNCAVITGFIVGIEFIT